MLFQHFADLRILMRAWLACSSAIVSLALGMTAKPAHAGPALLFDATSGQVLYAEDQDDSWYPASLTKIMTAYITFEAIKTGKLTLDQKITVSEAALAQPPSKIGLPVGAEMSVDVALQALIIKSANDVAVMLAEAISGSETAFIYKMNETAKRLGMTKTTFVNPNGLPAPDQSTTARDLARLARAVMRDYPQYANYWTMAEMRIGKIRLTTHNALLKTFEGADGLKTGFTCDSGFNVVASATRDNRRLVAVVLGEPNGQTRAIRAASLLEHGFSLQGWKTMFNNTTVENLTVAKDAKSLVSMRQQITAWSCGNRPKKVRTAKTANKVGELKAKVAAAKAKATTPTSPTAPATAAPRAPAAAKPAAAKPSAAAVN
jgi:D-alanyl-D-alanine carboxypeptidase